MSVNFKPPPFESQNNRYPPSVSRAKRKQKQTRKNNPKTFTSSPHSHSLRHEISRRPPLATMSTTKINLWRVPVCKPLLHWRKLQWLKPLWNHLSCSGTQLQEWLKKEEEEERARWLKWEWHADAAVQLSGSWRYEEWNTAGELAKWDM